MGPDLTSQPLKYEAWKRNAYTFLATSSPETEGIRALYSNGCWRNRFEDVNWTELDQIASSPVEERGINDNEYLH
jgi:hypothetical protein